VVLKVTDFTHITQFIYFMHIAYNSVVFVVVVVVVAGRTAVVVQQLQKLYVVVVRNECYIDFLSQVMLC
jgi:hypothetical protein